MDATSGGADAARGPTDAEAARRLLPRHGHGGVDRLADLAAQLLGADSAQVSLLTEVQTIAGATASGAAGDESPLADSLCSVTARGGGPLVVADAITDDRVAGLPPVTSGAVGSYLGVPLRAGSGAIVGALCVFGPEPREWHADDVALLSKLAGPVAAELELGAVADEFATARSRWQVAIDAAGIGGFDWDFSTATLRWDERLLAMYGYDGTTFDGSLDAFASRLHPDDAGRVLEALRTAVAGCGGYSDEYRVVVPGASPRWVEARGQTLCDDAGRPVRFVGAAYETTAAREGEAQVARILESMSAAFYSIDRDWCFTYVNAQAEWILDRKRAELLGRNLWELFPAAVDSDIERHFRDAAETGEPTAFEAYYPEPLHGWFEVRVWPSADGLSVYFLDVTERRAAQERVALLAHVTHALAETLDPAEAVARFADMVVPALGDWCIVTLSDGYRSDGERSDWRRGLRDVGWSHRDKTMEATLAAYANGRLAAFADTAYLARALREQRAIVITDCTESIAATITDDVVAGLIRQLAPASAVVQPIRARGRTLGALMLYWNDVAEPDAATVDTVAEIAARAGLALDNARQFERERDFSEQLQRSLLTAPPEPDNMQIVVRYEPAAEVAKVGGDWYDAFLQKDGSTTVVIGDVIGHDSRSAAAMGQIRGLLRGIAAAGSGGPAEVLAQLDEVLALLDVNASATVLVARFEQSGEERARGVTRMRWSNAGHPPPLVIDADGTVAILADPARGDADLLLGVDATTQRHESTVALDRGATVLLYTDGLVERRGQSLDDGVAALGDFLTVLAHEPLDTLCDELLRRMLPNQREDDVALAAVRLHRQDLPRPASAGPATA